MALNKNIKIVKLMGGLGNQMFQYAFGKALEKKLGVEVLFDAVTNYGSNFDKNLFRQYNLNLFNTDIKFASEEQIASCNKKTIFPKFIRRLFNIDKFPLKYCENEVLCFLDNIFDVKNKYYYDGYFQSEKYFVDIKDKIVNDFKLISPLNEANTQMLNKVKTCNSVSVHIRRGDYLKFQNVYVIQPLEYYKKAVKYISKRVDNPYFFIFSDDIDWVKENLEIDYQAEIVNINNNETCYCDLWLMKHCKHNITANSSFSWWGAYLNENNNKIIVSPEKWFVSEKVNYDDLLPQNWIKL